jgi:uncharacterized tellurite resistance protein B-like protein
MTDANFILTLGKVLIATAWADGEVTNAEINCLKDLLFQLPGLTGREWAMLEMYIEAPVGVSERKRLLDQLRASLRSGKDRKLALEFIDRLGSADGHPTSEEMTILGAMKDELEAAGVGLFGQLGSVLEGALKRRQEVLDEAPNREAYFEDFIKNKVYYGIQRRSDLGCPKIELPEPRLRKLSLAGGLMARVAHVDRQVTQGEREAMRAALQAGWDLDPDEADFVVTVALDEIGADMDYYRLTRQFFTTTDEDERIRFLEVLFEIAGADGEATNEETEEIRTIANTLRLSHRQFIQVKMSLPTQKRSD